MVGCLVPPPAVPYPVRRTIATATATVSPSIAPTPSVAQWAFCWFAGWFVITLAAAPTVPSFHVRSMDDEVEGNCDCNRSEAHARYVVID